MNYQQATGKSIKGDFGVFHASNPKIYEHFKKYAFNWLATGATKISSKQIIGRIRWFVQVETTGNDFKINDAFTAHYARLFIAEYPEYESQFELRTLRS